MKNALYLPILLMFSLFATTNTNAQFSLVTSMGITPQQSPEGNYVLVNRSSPKSEFTFNLSQVKASYFLGAGTRFDANRFFFMGEAQYNKREYIYDIDYTYPAFGRSEQTIKYAETMHVINVPVSVGVTIGFMEVTSGFITEVIVSHQSELENISGYTEDLSPVRFGWHTGLAAKLSKFRIGANWQMDFNNYADYAYVNDESLMLQGKSGRIVGYVSYQF
jgi:hypothetical protein